ncbi:hypothetical protein ABBQ38_003286 [Trebouxia sp. C0009 RCD-2024]
MQQIVTRTLLASPTRRPGIYGLKRLSTSSSHLSLSRNHMHNISELKVQPLPIWGAEVHGVDVKQDLPVSTINKIREAVTQHRVLVFREQGVISGQRQVDISQWFGPCESTFYKHPMSPHPDIFRVSNTDLEGCTGVGRKGWHIDGSFMAKPFAHSTYHIVSCPSQADTIFAPLEEVVNSLPAERRERWERLHMLSDRRGGVAQPLIYPHPITGRATMCLHTGMTDAYVWDLDTPQEQVAGVKETRHILGELDQVFRREIGHLLYSHKWKPGDFIITDNLAVAHEASPQTQMTVMDVGLRVMHRTTIAGQHRLHK